MYKFALLVASVVLVSAHDQTSAPQQVPLAQCGCSDILGDLLGKLNLLTQAGNGGAPKNDGLAKPISTPTPASGVDLGNLGGSKLIDIVFSPQIKDKISSFLDQFKLGGCKKVTLSELVKLNATLAVSGPELGSPSELISLIQTKYTSIWQFITQLIQWFTIQFQTYASQLTGESQKFFFDLFALLQKFLQQGFQLASSQSTTVQENLTKTFPAASHSCHGWVVKKVVKPVVTTGQVNFTVQVTRQTQVQTKVVQSQTQVVEKKVVSKSD